MASKVHKEILPNGLTILADNNDANASASIGFFVRTGARDETDVESGVSHFLEHMMFKGTPTRSALDINLELGNLGAQANAFTSEENTVYYSTVIPEKFSAMQELLTDMLRPALDPEEFNMEKKVILEEIALYRDRPHFYLFETSFKDYFGSHPAGNSVLGSHESVSAISRDQMKDYFDRRYAPSNMTLVATGNLPLEQFMGDSSGSKLYWELIDKGLADSASVDSDERDGTGCFMVYVSTSPDRLDEVVSIAKKVVGAPLDFTDADLERAKAKIVSRIVLDGELPMGRLMSLGMEWTYRKTITPLAEVVRKVRAVTREDIQKSLEKFSHREWSEYRLLPE